MLKKNLEALCLLNGVSSWENEVRAHLRARAEKAHADSIRVDGMGSLIVHKKGKRPGGVKLMLCAHMDEVGLMITKITDEGYLKLDTVGGIDRRVLIGKPVAVGRSGVPGVIGLKAIHLTTQAERRTVPPLEQFYIDIGAGTRAEAEKVTHVGDLAAFVSDCVEFGDHMLKAKAIDDRVGCAVMAELMERDLPMDCTFAFTVQEEVGTRGAFGAAFSEKPDIALILEGTTAADSPTVPEHKRVCGPGGGPVVPYMDGGTIYDRKLFELLRDLAEENGLPWQTKEYVSGGTDARAVQRSRSGVRVAAISAAVRYLHAPSSVASLRDIDNMYALTRAFVDAVAAGRVMK